MVQASKEFAAGLPTVVFWEEFAFVAQCVSHDIAAQGDSKEEALERLEATIQGHRHFDGLDGREPLSSVPAPPSKYVELWRSLGGQPSLESVD